MVLNHIFENTKIDFFYSKRLRQNFYKYKRIKNIFYLIHLFGTTETYKNGIKLFRVAQ